jgi:ATP/maltotriose-dependent transcriptional regulator MalT
MTKREVEVLELMSSGLSNEEIAAHLSISLHTVKTHVSSILSKLDAARRTQAVDKAKNLNIIP